MTNNLPLLSVLAGGHMLKLACLQKIVKEHMLSPGIIALFWPLFSYLSVRVSIGTIDFEVFYFYQLRGDGHCSS